MQIADYKVFYLPYFTHYGAKAPRKKGFLTPTLQFTLGGGQGIITPYYLPINQNNDILFKPKFSFDQNFEFMEQYQLDTIINSKRSGGTTSISISNIKFANNDNINTSLKIDTKQVIDKNSIVTASGLFTNSISTTRSINEQPVKFEDLYLRFENYNLLTNDDYLKTELSSVESFDSTDLNSIPISPSLSYLNFVNLKNNSLINQLDFIILKRDKSTTTNPSESFKLNLNNDIISENSYGSITQYNKLSLNNSISDYYFKNNSSLNHNSFKSNLIISSELNYDFRGITSPKLKFIIPFQLENTDKSINEDSKSITFNYQNQFSDHRFFGNDLFDSSPRIVYGIENNFNLNERLLTFKINQSFQTDVNSIYSEKINQNSKFSDYAIESELSHNDYSFKIDARLDQENLSTKESNYLFNIEKSFNLNISYNETQNNAFKDLSNDTKSLIFNASKALNSNINIGFSSNLDVKNDYDPYKVSLNISLFDECSKLDISYSNTRFNDSFNTQPSEIISFTFSMDYLGFFGYEQSTNLLFSEPGNVKYGL